MIALTMVFALAGGILLLPTISDLWSLLRLALRPRPDRPPARPTLPPHLLLLVPAHDEELLLPACLASLRGMRYPTARADVVVVADNCRDRTAEIARTAGVRCLERHAPSEPGKPRAIAWALSQLAVSAYDAVVIVDADTEVDPGFAAALADATPLSDKALQPYNGVSNRTANALTRLSAVLSEANHGLAYVLKTRAGVNVPLSAGMCIGSAVLQRYGWTVGSLSEDWELYALLTARGVRVASVPGARIGAQEAQSLQASATQRRRWTAGKLAVLGRYAWPLLRSRHTSFAAKLDGLAELSAVGPVVQLGAVALVAAAALVLRVPAAGAIVALNSATLVRPFIYTTIAWFRDPEPGRAARAFAYLPVYAAWRLWTAAATVTSLGRGVWTRTERHARSEIG